MSDGLSDTAALDRLAAEVREAAFQLRDAVRRAEHGHRGLYFAVEPVVNEILAGAGYELRALGSDERTRR